MQIVIVGYGAMGRAIETFCKNKNIPIRSILKKRDEIIRYQANSSDVILDFTNGKAFVENIDSLLDKKVPIVVGTTGWDDEFENIKAKIQKSQVSFCWGKNFSISVYQFYNIVDFATKKLNSLTNLKIRINEVHHTNKKDSPSGTALNLKNIINKSYNSNVDITSNRIGNIIGEHSVIYSGDSEDIVLYHKSKSKDCYVEGALHCAEYLLKNNGFYFVEDIFKATL